MFGAPNGWVLVIHYVTLEHSKAVENTQKWSGRYLKNIIFSTGPPNWADLAFSAGGRPGTKFYVGSPLGNLNPLSFFEEALIICWMTSVLPNISIASLAHFNTFSMASQSVLQKILQQSSFSLIWLGTNATILIVVISKNMVLSTSWKWMWLLPSLPLECVCNTPVKNVFSTYLLGIDQALPNLIHSQVRQ